MILWIKMMCFLTALVCLFFSSFYFFGNEYTPGVWALISGALLLFISSTIVEIDE